jgi:acetyl-CoA C-acetyltransferase
MSLDPKTPVIVGVGAITQHVEDPREALEPLDLMAAALERAAVDAGAPALLGAVDSIWIPRGFWSYSSPGQLLAQRFDAPNVRNIVSEIGVLQTTLLGRAARAIARGESEVAMIVGGEARHRDLLFKKQGVEAPMTRQQDCPPDEVLRPEAEIMSRLEIELGLVSPTTQFAMIDNALRAQEGQSLKDYRKEVGQLWADASRVAAENPNAWIQTSSSVEEVVLPGPSNRMLSFPYTKSLVSQWNVNQAGALILCSLERARREGLAEDRFIYPLTVVDSEAMLPLSERRDLHRSPGFERAFAAALAHVDRSIEEIEALELYSCFPAAVRVQQRALGLDSKRRVTQTGGMTFAGGPLNNFVLQAWVGMVERLRGTPGAMGLVTAVSGFLTKQGVSLLGPEPSRPFSFDRVSEAVRAEQATIRIDPRAEGRARVASYTVICERDGTKRVVLFLDFDCDRDSNGARRRVRVETDADLAEEAMSSELCGRELVLGADGEMRWL